MGKYRKRPIVIEATQWFSRGDHPCVAPYEDFGHQQCSGCGIALHAHGQCATLEGKHIVCPGDWIITGVKGELYSCKADIFEAIYEPVGETSND